MIIGGVPTIYLGDEIGTLNDTGYERDREKIGDTRWLHRSKFDVARAEARRDLQSIPGRIYQGLARLIQLRKQNLAFTRAETEIVDSGNQHVFGYFRHHDEHSVLVLANFSEAEQRLDARRLRLLGLRKTIVDLVAGRWITAAHELVLEPYQLAVLTPGAPASG